MTESIERTLGNIEAKVDMLLDSHASFEKRVSSLEKWRNLLTGAYSLLVLAAGYFKLKA